MQHRSDKESTVERDFQAQSLLEPGRRFLEFKLGRVFNSAAIGSKLHLAPCNVKAQEFYGDLLERQ